MIQPARTGLDRLAHRRADAEWLAEAWERALVLVVSDDRVLVGADDMLALVPSAQAPDGDRFFLGGDGAGTVFFVVMADLPALPGTRPATLREVAHRLSELDATLLTTGLALVNWHRRHAYSPADGSPTTVGDGGWTRVTVDGRNEFPRTDPAVIVLVHDGVAGEQGRCLLGHNATWNRPGWTRRFSCLAGFVEPGESAEAAVEREVFEEVGAWLTGVSYVGSQAWPFPGSLMLGFTATADPARPLHLDRTEIDEARWLTRSQVRAVIEGRDDSFRLPPPASIAFRLISGWLDAPEPSDRAGHRDSQDRAGHREPEPVPQPTGPVAEEPGRVTDRAGRP